VNIDCFQKMLADSLASTGWLNASSSRVELGQDRIREKGREGEDTRPSESSHVGTEER
jgi:hypothetical protein